MEFDFLIPLDDDSSSGKKRVRTYEEDELTIGSTKTTDYFNPTQDDIMDLSSVESARVLARPLAPN